VQLSNKIKKYILTTHSLIQPKLVFKEKKIKKTEPDSVILRGDIVLVSGHLSRAVKKCNRLTFFLATIGKELDDLVNSLMKKRKINEAYVCDAIGSVAVESIVDGFQNYFDEKSRRYRECTTMRFSPGYCDWQVHEQKKLFEVIDKTLIDVELNPSCLMTPRKSVSGVFGIGRMEHVNAKTYNPCRVCDLNNCISRRN
jgi:hypothetical protein